jgi:hypothetical protein
MCALPTSKGQAPRRSVSTCQLRYAKALGQSRQQPCNRSSEIRLHQTHQWPSLALVSSWDASLSALITWPASASGGSSQRAPERHVATPDIAFPRDAAPHVAALLDILGNTADRGHTRHIVAPGRGNARTERGDILALTEKAPTTCPGNSRRAFLHSHSPVHEAQAATWASTVSAHRVTTRR